VTTSSLPPTYSTTLDSSSFSSLQTIQISALTTADITMLTGSGGFGGTGSYTYSIPSNGSGTTISSATIVGGGGTGATYQNVWVGTEEFKDGFPAWDRIQKMCKTYPGLEIAFEKFKTTYYLVKDDYDHPKEK